MFTGGEPLMHSDLFRLSAMLRGRGIRTTILSTGLLLERNAARIVEGADEVIVSLDGPAKIHDEIRRVPGAFDSLAKGVRAVHRLSPAFPISARCTVQARNAAHLRDTAQAAREMGLRSLSFLAADLSSTRVQSCGGMAAGAAVRSGAGTRGTGARDGSADRRLPGRRVHSGNSAEAAPHCGALPRPLRTGAACRAALQCAVGFRGAGIERRCPSLLLSRANRKHRGHYAGRGR